MVTSLGGIEVAVDEWGGRHRLQRDPEVPGRPAGPGAADRLAAGPRAAGRAARRAGTSTSTCWPATSTTAPARGACTTTRRPWRWWPPSTPAWGPCSTRVSRRPGSATPSAGGCCRTGSIGLGLELLVERRPPPAPAHHGPGPGGGRRGRVPAPAPRRLRDRDRGRGRTAGRAGLAHRLHGPHGPPPQRARAARRARGGAGSMSAARAVRHAPLRAPGPSRPAAVADRGRLPGLARGAHPLRRLAAALGAPAQGCAGAVRGPPELRGPLRHPRAGTPPRHRLRLRDLRRASASPAR